MSRVLPKSGGALCDVQGYERPALAGPRLQIREEAAMHSRKYLPATERQEEAVDLLVAVLTAFGREAEASQNSPITPTGLSVFRALAERRGAFLRPVPFRRDDLATLTCASKGAVNAALRQLAANGFLVVSGPRTAPMAKLQFPQAALDDFTSRENRKADQARKHGYSGPLWSFGIDEAKSVLDED
jgi:hypothetical protein